MAKRLTTEEFVRRAKEVHGDLYDYNKVKYVNQSTKVEIIDPVYGSFLQLPNNHLSGKGHIERGRQRTRQAKFKGKDYFVEKAKEIHGDKYDYSRIKYVDMSTHVEIICPDHGVFKQTPANHTHKRQPTGCPQCAELARNESKRKTKESFIEAAKEVHGELYDYSKINYVDRHTKVEIIDPEFGSWWCTPSNHLSGSGHPDRRATKIANALRKSQEDFIAEAKAFHGDKYDYSKVNYINTNTKVEIIDPDFGSWWVTPSNHLKRNSPFLQYQRVSEAKRSNTEEFIAKAKKIHGDLYIYDKVEYKTCADKVEIIDPVFGSWMVTPNAHLCGKGNPDRCGGTDSLHKFKADEVLSNSDCYFYIADIDGEFIKPGITRSLKNRADASYSNYLFVSPKLSRCEAWAIEKNFLHHTIDAFVTMDELPKKYLKWGGKTELRHKNMFSMNDLRWHFDKLLRELERVGWEQLALNAN